MIGKRVSFLYSNSSACPVQEIASRPCRWLDILVISRNFVLCRLGSVCAKHVTDETNELSYLVDACEVNFYHFLPLISSLRHQFHRLLILFPIHIFIHSISEAVKIPCYLVVIDKKRWM